MQLEGKSAIVTGSSSGIGRAAALALANAGADVAVNGNSNMEAAEEVAHEIEQLGRKSLAVQADVSNAEDVDRLVTHAVETPFRWYHEDRATETIAHTAFNSDGGSKCNLKVNPPS